MFEFVLIACNREAKQDAKMQRMSKMQNAALVMKLDPSPPATA
jgi:hypothetical protein